MSDTVEPTAPRQADAAEVAEVAEVADIEDRTPRGIAFRAFVYLVAVHVISAFFFLLFYLGDR
ncbi:hypothetical protein I5Q34_29505 [Streptomyces sp. AV19]|uniref:DUF6126 family protein n=1 Tax=Streptomyces sp. AV19 TaxID=2793068 RepID=UPI0018FEE6EC|nr:DUF6126 family protein [Streptomyces sp. AV19]MBH1938346.1 hypothetical protein [Streptomyces sp. AV19]MDG4534995.1 DUF6126 family protein [Streptomyces sp. AV19]